MQNSVFYSQTYMVVLLILNMNNSDKYAKRWTIRIWVSQPKNSKQ